MGASRWSDAGKPPITFGHNRLGFELGYRLQRQLNPRAYVVGVNGGRVRRSETNVYIPDVFVTRNADADAFRYRDDVLETYREPVLLVVEVWSQSTGDYDVEEKLVEYQERGDHEIWRLHPFERTLTIWRRSPDWSYAESVHREGIIHSSALPGVSIDLTELFSILG